MEAIDSVFSQTFQGWKLIVMDSGVLYDSLKFTDNRIEIYKSGETSRTRSQKAMAPWCFNECFRRNLVDTDLIVYMGDDDIWYENAFETFVNFHNEKKVDAMYASQDIAYHFKDGSRYVIGERRAIQLMGKTVNRFVSMDCKVDMMQFCHTKNVWTLWPEDKDTESHADGVFMDKIGKLVTVHPIDIKVSQNRRTPLSTYAPTKQ
jgi:glycosyltransferase involved in cell wall biosynthesis